MTTLILARIFSFYFIVIGLTYFNTPSRIRAVLQAAQENVFAQYVAGIMALLIGGMIISVHNDWTLGWSVLLTVIGWIALVKGTLFILFPNVFLFFAKLRAKSDFFFQIMGVVITLVGLFFFYHGWLS